MFQFPGFALKTLCIQVINNWFTKLLAFLAEDNNKVSVGLPHSEIFGYSVYSRLPKAYRRVSRPSSPLTAKASTKRPSRAWSDPEIVRLFQEQKSSFYFEKIVHQYLSCDRHVILCSSLTWWNNILNSNWSHSLGRKAPHIPANECSFEHPFMSQ